MDKQITKECKYKFQDKEKFNGQSYCTLHNEICKDLSFVCDANCQVYEDYKQLKQAEQTVNECHKYMTVLEDKLTDKEQYCEELKEANNTLTVTREKLLCDLWIAEESLKDYKAHYDRQCDELDQLKAENEKLRFPMQDTNYAILAKEEFEEYKKLKQTLAENQKLKHDNGYETGALERTIDNLKKEIDQLKRQHDGDKGLITATGKQNYQLIQEYDKLKAENEELKKQACGLRPELKYIIDKTCCKYHINAKYYHEKIVEIINNLDKYTQTITEIKEIAENGCYDDCGMPLDELSIILQKISEVEDES